MVRRWGPIAAVAALAGCVPDTPAVAAVPSSAPVASAAPIDERAGGERGAGARREAEGRPSAIVNDPAPVAHQSESVAAFTQMLDKRLAAEKKQVDPAEIAKIDEAVRLRFERPLGVMITDMSGMTELTKQRGTIGILALIREMQHVTVPVVKKHGGTWVKMEADDLFVTHPSAKSLYATAREMLDAIADQASATKDDSIKMGIGLGFGKVLDLGDDIWGDPVNTASKLGEDTAEPGEILMSDEFHAQLIAEGGAAPECKLVDAAARKAKFAYYRCGK